MNYKENRGMNYDKENRGMNYDNENSGMIKKIEEWVIKKTEE